MDIEILHVPGCPNLHVARSGLEEALKGAGLVARIRETEIATADAAVEAGMRGSPTILIDGRDPFDAASNRGSLSCRLYPGDSRLEGAPTVHQFIALMTQ